MMTADEFFETIEKNIDKGDVALCEGVNCFGCFVKEEYRTKGCYKHFIKYLIQENRELKNKLMKSGYTLKRHEYALLSSLGDIGDIENKRMKDERILNAYRLWGYFDGVDENALIEDVLDRCEVIDDD